MSTGKTDRSVRELDLAVESVDKVHRRAEAALNAIHAMSIAAAFVPLVTLIYLAARQTPTSTVTFVLTVAVSLAGFLALAAADYPPENTLFRMTVLRNIRKADTSSMTVAGALVLAGHLLHVRTWTADGREAPPVKLYRQKLESLSYTSREKMYRTTERRLESLGISTRDLKRLMPYAAYPGPLAHLTGILGLSIEDQYRFESVSRTVAARAVENLSRETPSVRVTMTEAGMSSFAGHPAAVNEVILPAMTLEGDARKLLLRLLEQEALSPTHAFEDGTGEKLAERLSACDGATIEIALKLVEDDWHGKAEELLDVAEACSVIS